MESIVKKFGFSRYAGVGKHWAVELCGENIIRLRLFRQKTTESSLCRIFRSPDMHDSVTIRQDLVDSIRISLRAALELTVGIPAFSVPPPGGGVVLWP
jgi:hypothetical protein